jgi:ribonucleoside-diphosphate reductase alpha chain
MTGRAYAQSARDRSRAGPLRALRREPRRAQRTSCGCTATPATRSPTTACVEPQLLDGRAHRLGRGSSNWASAHGYRNAQATVLAPTGCLVAGSLVSTSRGLVRMRSLGDVDGSPSGRTSTWRSQPIKARGEATKFFVNGSEQVVSIETKRGYRHPGHTGPQDQGRRRRLGSFVWRRMADVEPGDRVPMMLGTWLASRARSRCRRSAICTGTSRITRTRVPRRMSADLAEFVGYFMGDGSLARQGPAHVRDGRRRRGGRQRLHRARKRAVRTGRRTSSRARDTPSSRFTPCRSRSGGRRAASRSNRRSRGTGARAGRHTSPTQCLHSNDRDVYAAFVRGLFEADGNANHGYAYWNTTLRGLLAQDVQTLLLSARLRHHARR